MKPPAWSGACPAPWPEPAWPTVCFLWTRWCPRSSGRLGTDDLMPAAELCPESYRFLQDYVYRESGIVLDGDKRYLLEARLTPIVQQLRLGDLNDLCAMLGRPFDDPTLKRQVVE